VKRWLLPFSLLGGLVVLPAQPSLACSCVGIDNPRAAVEAADGAFVGTLVRREEPQPQGELLSSDQVVTWTFQVDRLLKGSIGSTVDVESPWSDVSCGLLVEVGEQAGLLLSRTRGQWQSGLCSQIDPDTLLRVAVGFSPPEIPDPTPKVLANDESGPRWEGAWLIALVLTVALTAAGAWAFLRRARSRAGTG
jgi:hypothetical protein